ncbi:ATP-binding protein [Streptomyces sp. NPDC004533]|uniref:ATP-binding protein n=1 Tax=Streptomyces sp. NPDC004533 TaxID=3154278 RepID=UPI0033AC6D3B
MPPRDAGSTSLLEAPPRPAGTVPAAFNMALASTPSSVEVARRVARAWVRCYCRMQADQVDDVLIVMSELCTNAIQYGRSESIDVRGWAPAPGELRFEVHDWSPSAVPAPQYVDPDAEGGRGLVIVDALVAEMGGAWGFIDEGTCAWVHLVLAGLGR